MPGGTHPRGLGCTHERQAAGQEMGETL